MGRGDKRSKKGKIFRGSYGKTRFRKKKLFKLRLKKAHPAIKVSQPVIEQKPENKDFTGVILLTVFAAAFGSSFQSGYHTGCVNPIGKVSYHKKY